jgi:Mrp family chromosome partitioning ATPase
MPHMAASAPGAIHIVLQGKGGVGKSFIALHLAQYFADRGLPTAARSVGMKPWTGRTSAGLPRGSERTAVRAPPWRSLENPIACAEPGRRVC